MKGKKTLMCRISTWLNVKTGGDLPHLTICAEAWIKHQTTKVFILDCLMYVIYRERNHCCKQYIQYGKNHPHE